MLRANSEFQWIYKHQLAVTVIVKDEGLYIEEWLNYHIMAGVEIFYVYDHESKDDTRIRLEPYINAGYVIYRYVNTIPEMNMQLVCYNDAVVQYRFDCEFMAFIDVDEFLVPRINQPIYSCLKPLFLVDTSVGALKIHWKIFGSAGLEKHPDSVIFSYLYRATDDFHINRHVKSIVNPRKVLFIRNPHAVMLMNGAIGIDDGKHIVYGALDDRVSYNILQINHYFCKSKEDWLMKMKRGRVDKPKENNTRTWDDFKAHDKNDCKDVEIINYIDKMFSTEVKTSKFYLDGLVDDFLNYIIDGEGINFEGITVENFISAYENIRRRLLNQEDEDLLHGLMADYIEYLAKKNTIQYWELDHVVGYISFLRVRNLENNLYQQCYDSLYKLIYTTDEDCNIRQYYLSRLDGELFGSDYLEYAK